MKRIYMTLALLGGLALGAQAQTIDFLSAIDKPVENQSLVPGTTLDTSKALLGWGVGSNEGILNGDKVAWQWSFNEPDEMWITTFSADFADSNTFLQIFPNASMNPPHSHAEANKLAVDSIGILIDWEQYSQNDTIIYLQRPFVDCKEYGFFIDVFGLFDGTNLVGTDPDPNNNLSVVKVKWNCGTGTGLNDIIAPKNKEALTLYPNPTSDVVKFKYNFKEFSTTTVKVVDITGRTVINNKLGRLAPGEREISVDVASLPAGNYSVVLETETKVATSKLTIKK